MVIVRGDVRVDVNFELTLSVALRLCCTHNRIRKSDVLQVSVTPFCTEACACMQRSMRQSGAGRGIGYTD